MTPVSKYTEVDHATYLYEMAYPDHAIDLYPSYVDAPVSERAVLIDPKDAPSGDVIACGLRHMDAPQITAQINIARAATPDEIMSYGQPSIMASRKMQWLFRLSPLAFEYGKYRLEYSQKRKPDAALSWPKHLLDLPAIAPQRRSDVRPAILIGMHWLEHGGAEKLGFDTMHWALEAGLRVIVVTEKDGLHRLAHRMPDHPDVTFLRMDRYLPAKAISAFLCNLIARENITSLHIHHCTPVYEALPEIRAAHPDITVIDSTHIIEYSDTCFSKMSGRWSNYIDHHHVISATLATMFETRFGADDKHRLGRLLDRAVDDPASVPFSMSAGKAAITVGFVGRMTHQKRPLLVAYQIKSILAWAQSHNVTVDFQIVGEGPYLSRFKTLLARFKLDGVTTLHGADADIPAIFDMTDILLLPSSNEGLALVCYEAIEHGVIPISSDVGAQSELLPDTVLTDWHPVKTVKQTLDIIKALWSNQAILERAKQGLWAGYDKISQDPTAYEVLMPIYQKAIKQAE